MYVGDIVQDTHAPSIVQTKPTSSTTLEVTFSEIVDVSTVQDPLNYEVNNNVGYAVSANLKGDEKTVMLTFSKSFKDVSKHQLTAKNVGDKASNIINETSGDFLYFEKVSINPKDVILTEFFRSNTLAWLT